ncbi:MAG: hypothetical protein K2J30_02080 [Clostridia bacterium]|nr:hypothetical protein [Clostridia bacterium]
MKETKIIQVYPSDSAIEGAIKEWESFGWELVNNQRYSDKSSVTIPYIGTETTTTTYNKLTFSREKNSPWYYEVKQLEEDYEAVKRNISNIIAYKPKKKKFGVGDAILLYIPIPIVLEVIRLIVRKAKFKKASKRFERDWAPKLRELDIKAERLQRSAQRVIDSAY